MSVVPISNITKHLSQSIGLEASEKLVADTLAVLGIPRKDTYTSEDYTRILAELKKKGGIIASIVEIASADRYLAVVAHKEREETFRNAYNIVKKSPVVLISWTNDTTTTIEFITDNIATLLGYSAEEIVNTRNRYLDYAPPEFQDKILELFKTLLTTTDKTLNLEHPIITKSGDTKWVDCRIFVNKNSEGKATQFQGILLDITDRVVSEMKLKELNELRQTSLKVLSHQMRTPLTITNFSASQMLSQHIGEDQKKLAESIQNASTRAISILDDILVALDITENTVAIHAEVTDVVALAREAFSAAEEKYRAKGIAFHYSLPETPLSNSTVDVKKMRLILNRILDNALIFTRPGGTVEAGINQPDPAWLSFFVKDTGIGIPQAEQHRVFSSFFRATNAFKLFQNASGLSLYIAKSYLSQMGGEIGFESVEDQGSTFWVRLPATR